jgi:starch synthase (maltosyl-transferring)
MFLPRRSSHRRPGRASGLTALPRSFGGTGRRAGRSELAELGFDVLYFRPSTRSGPRARKAEQHPRAAPEIQGRGRSAVRGRPRVAELGRSTTSGLVASAAEHGLEIALDFHYRCSPTTWLKGTQWFGTAPTALRYAENPPALPGHLQPELRLRGLAGTLAALLDLVLGWASHGIPLPASTTARPIAAGRG